MQKLFLTPTGKKDPSIHNFLLLIQFRVVKYIKVQSKILNPINLNYNKIARKLKNGVFIELTSKKKKRICIYEF